MRTRLKLEPKVAPKLKQKINLVYVGAGAAIVSVIGVILFFYLQIGNQEESYAQNQNYASRASGNWTQSSTWQGGNVPPTSGLKKDAINIDNSVTLSGDLTIDGELSLTINGGATLVIDGDLIAQNNLTLMVNGLLIITGNITAKNGANITINGGGNVDVSGNAEFQQNTRLWVDGNLEIGGNISFGKNAVFGGNGYATMGGSGCSGWTGQNGRCVENSLLPVQLLSFDAQPENGSVVISWETASELNNDFFEIERSANGTEFSTVAKVNGSGTTKQAKSYEYIDQHPVSGVSYYRLKQTDFDGGSETFRPVSVTVEGLSNENTIEIFPNPLLGASLHLKMDEPESGSLEIYNQNGNKVFDHQIEGFSSEEEFSLPSNIMSGIYYVKVITASTKKSFKLVKK